MASRSALIAVVSTALLGVALVLTSPPLAGLAAERAQAACGYAHGGSSEITRRQARDAVVCLINNRRDARGKRNLSSHGELKEAAGRHSRRMRHAGCFSHQCPGEKDLAGRISSTSYLPCGCSWGIGENIAWGSRGRGTPVAIVKAWMGSAGHRRNILDADFRHIGVGVAWGSPSNPCADAAIYTADFGYRR
jgi:uncharacterized protein YkwD